MPSTTSPLAQTDRTAPERETDSQGTVEWSPLDIFGSSSWSQVREDKVVYEASVGDYALSNHSARQEHFACLVHTIDALTENHEDRSFFLEKDVAERARHTAWVLFQNTRLDAPKLMTQDGEAAVFTWFDGMCKRLISVDDELTGMTTINVKSMIKCSMDFEGDTGQQIASLLSELKELSSSSAR